MNGTTGGTDIACHIADSNSVGNYTAPNSVPAANPVNVSCTVDLGTKYTNAISTTAASGPLNLTRQ